MTEEAISEILAHAPESRRKFLRNLLLAAGAFTVPVVASFTLGGSGASLSAGQSGGSNTVDNGSNTVDNGSNTTTSTRPRPTTTTDPAQLPPTL